MKRRILIKIGGRAFEGKDGFTTLGHAIKKLLNAEVLIVHGGGTEISQALRAANREPVFIDGLRVTTAEDIEIVERVLSHEINARIADHLEKCGLACRRMSGRSNNLILVKPLTRNGHTMGFVGKIRKVNPDSLFKTLEQGCIPVISPISNDHQGNAYNVNADSAAAAIAGGVKCNDLIYFTDVPGVRVRNETLSFLTVTHAKELIENGIIKEGMIAKMESIFEALDAGVERVHIANWHDEYTLLNIFDTREPLGTAIFKDSRIV